VTGAGAIAGLQLVPTPATGLTVTGPDAGVFSVTGMSAGTSYSFIVRSTHYQDVTVTPTPYVATPNGKFTPAAVTVTLLKQATAIVTVTGGPNGGGAITVTADPAAAKQDRTDKVFTLTLSPSTPTTSSYTFTASANGFVTATSPATTVIAGGTVNVTLNLVDEPKAGG
jgi:hypothetical protein